MKKCGVIAALVLLATSSLRANFCDHTGISFMFPRPIVHNVAMIQNMWHDFLYNKKGDARVSMQIAGLYQESVTHNKLRRYFLFNHQDVLTVKGDTAPRREERDIRAEWLQLPSSFHGNFTISPKRREFGFLMEFNQDLGRFNIPFFERTWINITVPVTHIEQLVNPYQDVKSAPSQQDLLTAFNRENMVYGRIANVPSIIDVPEIRIKTGKAFISEDYTQVASYNVFVLPTGHKNDPTYVFNNTSGSNGHFGFGSGVSFQIPLNKDTSCYAFCFFINLEQVFFARSSQWRTFDLKDKPWSRYLLLNEKSTCKEDQALLATQAPIPAANVLTNEVRIRPFNMIDCSLGWRLKSNNFEAEIGYNAWGHGDERAEVDHPKGHGYNRLMEQRCQFFCNRVYGIRGSDGAHTASTSDISCLGPDDNEFIPITICDIDWRSGAGKATLTHKFHAAIAYNRQCCRISGFMSAGVFYEAPHNNCALEQWGVWLKLGASI